MCVHLALLGFTYPFKNFNVGDVDTFLWSSESGTELISDLNLHTGMAHSAPSVVTRGHHHSKLLQVSHLVCFLY